MNNRWFRALLGFAFVATMLVAIIAGEPANAQNDGFAAPAVSQAPVAVNTSTRTTERAAPSVARISGEVVTTLPETGIGPSDPDKRVTHWLFVIGGTLVALAHFELARRKLNALATANVEHDR